METPVVNFVSTGTCCHCGKYFQRWRQRPGGTTPTYCGMPCVQAAYRTRKTGRLATTTGRKNFVAKWPIGSERQAIETLSIKGQQGGCGEWKGYLFRGVVGGNPYGRVRIGGVMEYAHRVAYRGFKGPIPNGLAIDHL